MLILFFFFQLIVDFADDGKYENKKITGDGQSHHLPFFVKEELSGDELEELINDRYAHGSEHVTYNDDSAECDVKASEADGMKDVIIWKVKCMVPLENLEDLPNVVSYWHSSAS